ncbi:Intracellular beta-1,3-endoglucanase [Komagataella phaffii CBS 7435]|uniref:glucan endo-1,3-beta-D-glucosidase n=1 Tax=Komagataella phaffii (strain ATCC 76273 / CBS 7435 / CECT 11047 / NRRL Y-11430 / Wegner 21-1) TaxID=981350 RepID=F2R054_KOMPC|nr:GQ67_04445T0 [Komagataella phaffii]AOA69510.1 GQ68_04417T0 [Komagataella phaffii GS115]CAH2451293.1 Intracellular beta-1,3-endoglucanase [Komagataella phaffii CBS 7435]CCA41032.1 Intracellular beta-1,3-endoglucanase [Komagataella phaffii CBS 7435]
MSDTSGNLFQPVATSTPTRFPLAPSPVGLPAGLSRNLREPLTAVQTNNFYGNILLGDQTTPIYTNPYALWYSKNTGDGFNGLAISQTSISQRHFADGNPPQFFYSPVGIKYFVMSAREFESNIDIDLDTPRKFSINVNLTSGSSFIQFPVVQGMGFITGVYYNLIPYFHSAVGIRSVAGDIAPRNGIDKYRIELFDDSVWTLYVNSPQRIQFARRGSNSIIGSNSVHGAVIQLIRGSHSDMDQAAGCYPTAASVAGSVLGSDGIYSINYATTGNSNSGNPLILALPHHVNTFTDSTNDARTGIRLDDQTHGTMVGVLTKKLEMRSTLPTNVSFEPWSQIPGFSTPSYSQTALTAIRTAAVNEGNNDIAAESNLDSMYFSGKVLSKYALVLWSAYYVVGDRQLAENILSKMKAAIERFSNNNQINGLAYDTTWKGVVSSGGLGGHPEVDFGNTYYNDHHFHYGYHVHAAAVTAHVDKALGGNWVDSIKDWVNTLIRDYANPSSDDPHFPVFRAFDWYVGHSWAKGIIESTDGKDEESSSEDYHSYYGIKLWAKVIGDSAMEDRSNLMLGILNTSLNSYMLYRSDNTIMPSNFIPNKVCGIFFSNKVDHTTWFSNELVHIQGIHMLPITSLSSFVRDPQFTREEWETKLQAIVDSVDSGWRGILMLNLALFNPRASFDFFNNPDLPVRFLDDGMTKTWSLVYSAGVGGSPA